MYDLVSISLVDRSKHKSWIPLTDSSAEQHNKRVMYSNTVCNTISLLVYFPENNAENDGRADQAGVPIPVRLLLEFLGGFDIIADLAGSRICFPDDVKGWVYLSLQWVPGYSEWM